MQGTRFIDWYRTEGRSLLQRVAPQCLEEAELSVSRGQPDVALPVFVVGNAGVGKSTLVNTLLSDRLSILPQGGLGPFTAGAARVVYCDDPYARISYRGPEALLAILDQLRQPASATHTHALHSARLLVQGNQFGSGSRTYLATCLANAGRGELVGQVKEVDRGRVSEIAEVMRSESRVRTLHAGSDLPAFLLDLKTHGAGFLAPLTADIEIGWAADFLAPGLQLVDLPGVGVANDSFRRTASEVLGEARAALLVVNRSGLSRDAADLLLPLLARLLDGDSNAKLVIVVTQVDLVAEDAWRAEAEEHRRPWLSHFDETATALVRLVRAQLREELARVQRDRGRSLDPEVSCALNTIDIRPVAPIEHRKLSRRAPRDPARVASSADTRIEGLRELLAGLARQRQASLASVIDIELESAEQRYALVPELSGYISHVRRALANAVGA